MADVKLDEIGYWSEVKLDIIKKYAKAYSTIMAKQPWCKGHHYIDAFAGAGVHISKATGGFVEGSPLIALNTGPPFTNYHLIDLDSGRTENLQRMVQNIPSAKIYQGDCNEILLKEVFPILARDPYKRALCLLDPYGLHLDWKVMRKAGELGTVEIFLNFPVADINRNALRRDRDSVEPKQAARLTSFWGDESWKEIAYNTQNNLFAYPEKEDNETIAEAFRKRLKNVAGFKHVLDPMPMRNKNNAVVYYLYFATPKDVADKIVRDIFKTYRNRQGN